MIICVYIRLFWGGGGGDNSKLKIAAILVIVLLPTYYIIHRQYSDQNLYASCNTKYPDHITTMGSSDDEVISAMSLYNNEKYDEAASFYRTKIGWRFNLDHLRSDFINSEWRK